MIKRHYLVLLAVLSQLTACTGLFDKDNTPEPKALTPIQAEITPKQLWATRTGKSSNPNDFLKFNPSLKDGHLYTASQNGTLSSINEQTGRIEWQVNTHATITSGPGAGNGIVVVGTRQGDIIALEQADGRQRWKTNLPGEVLAQPAISDGKVIIKATDGHIRALAVNDGAEWWTFQQIEPSLILRGSSRPLIRDHFIFAGFANGHLAKIGLNNGQTYWMQQIARAEGGFPIQRMIDIDADPVIYDYHLYAATYQGKITALSWNSGDVLWSHDISSYTGMAADNRTVYVSDAQSYVWAFGANNGLVNWRQVALESRHLSGPANMGDYVVVGDAQGYLHWLNKRDGHIAAREFVGSPIYATPIVNNNVLYAFTNSGYLVAYTLS